MNDKLTYSESTPDVAEYLELRQSVDFSPRTEEAARRGLPGSLWAITVRDHDGRLIGMARVVGDGGCSYLVVDVIVHPEFQGQGIGSEMMRRMDAWIDRAVPRGAMISLLADVPGRKLYERHGFEYAAPDSVGMKRRIAGDRPTTTALQ